jgi:hypothetical protein
MEMLECIFCTKNKGLCSNLIVHLGLMTKLKNQLNQTFQIMYGSKRIYCLRLFRKIVNFANFFIRTESESDYTLWKYVVDMTCV